MAERSLKLVQRAFEGIKAETIMTKLASAFYDNHLKQTAFGVWTDSATMRRFVGGVGRGLRKLALRRWFGRARSGTNRMKSHLYRLRRVFDVLKSSRIAALTIHRKQLRMQKSILHQWSALAKDAKADRFYTQFCLSAWVQALQVASHLRTVLREWRQAAKIARQVKTQRKVRNRAAVCSMRDRREERSKRRILRELRKKTEEAGSRRKKIRIKTRDNERKTLESVFKVWKTAAKRDFSAYIRGKKTVRAWQRAASVQAKGRKLHEKVQNATLRGIIREIRGLSSSKILTSVKLSHDFNISRIKTRYFHFFKFAVHMANSLSAKALKMYEISLKKTAFSAFLSMYQRKIRLATISTEQGKNQYNEKRVIFAGLKSFTRKSLLNRKEKSRKWLQRRTLLLLFAWRKRTIEGEIEDEQTVVNFRVQKLAKLGFQSLSMLTWNKRLIRFKRNRIGRFLHLWRNWSLQAKAFFPFSRKTRLPDKGKERKAEAKLRERQRAGYWERWKLALCGRRVCEALQERRRRKFWEGWLDFLHRRMLVKRAKVHFDGYWGGKIVNSWKIAANRAKSEKRVKGIRQKVTRNFRLDHVFPIFRKAVSCSRIVRRNFLLAEQFRRKKAFSRFLLQTADRKETIGKLNLAAAICAGNSKRTALQKLKMHIVKAKTIKEMYENHEKRLLSNSITALNLHKNRQNHKKTIQFKRLKALFSLWISQVHLYQLLKDNQFTKAVALTPNKMTKQRKNIALEWRQNRLQKSVISQWRFRSLLFLAVKEAGKSLNS